MACSVALSTCTLFSGEVFALDLVKGGAAAEIRVPAASEVSSRHAAEELARYVGKMSGVTPEVRVAPPTQSSSSSRVIIGTLATLKDLPDDIRSRLAAEKSHEASVLSVRGETLWIVGKEGVAELNAVHRLLDKLGVRWLQIATKEDPGEYVPERKEIALEPFEEYRSPAFARRSLHLVASAPWPISTNSIDFLQRNGMQGHSCGCGPFPFGLERRIRDLVAYTNFFNARWPAAEQTLGGGHCMFNRAMPPATFFETHPEYFALVDGKRMDYRGKEHRAQYCVSNPEVQRRVADFIIEKLDIVGGRGSYLYGNADTVYGWCECANCRALDPPGAQKADVSVRFNKAVAKIDALVRTKYPDAHLVLWAYSNYRELTDDVRHDPRIEVEFCDHERCQAHRLDDPTCGRNVRILKLMKKWMAISSSLHTYEYLTDSNWEYSCCERMEADTLRLYRRLGIKGLSNEGHFPDANVERQYASPAFFDNIPSNWQYFYCTGRLMWNPDLDVEKLLEEGETLYYGPAAPVMRQYHQYRRKLWDARHECMGYSLGNQRTPMLLSVPGAKEKLLGFLAEAEKMVGVNSSSSRKETDHLSPTPTRDSNSIIAHRIANDRRWLTEYWIKPYEKVLARQGKTLFAPKPTTPVVVDGADDEGAWAGAQYLTTFGRPADPSAFKPAPEELKTTVGLLADDDAWYFFVRATDPAARQAKFAAAGQNAWDGCGMEFFLFPPSVENRYFQIAANPNGVVTAVARSDGEVLNVPIRAVGKVTDGEWTLEIRIPAKGLYGINANDIWKINVCRNRTVRDTLTPTGANWSLNGIGYHDTTDYQPVSVGQPYLPNGSFSDLDEKGMPKKWTFSGNRPNEVVSEKGNNAVRVRGTILQSLWHGALAQSPEPRSFAYSFRAKGPGKVTVYFRRAHDENDPKAPHGYRRSFERENEPGGVFETTDAWAVYSGEHTVRPNEWLMLGIAADDVLIDDVSVRPIVKP